MITKFKPFNNSPKRLILLISWMIIISFRPSITNTQSVFPNLSFRTITTKDGLTSNDIRAITQGDDGQIWIGTGNGLNSYDGNKITNYYQGKNSRININMSGIFTMVKDKKNTLWLSDRTGLTKVDLDDYKTTHFDQFQNVHQLIVRDSGICFAADNEIFQINDEKVLNVKAPSLEYTFLNTKINKYFKANIDRNKQLYLTSVSRIHKITDMGQEEKIFQTPDSLQITNLLFDNQNKGWVSTWGSGLYLINPNSTDLLQILKPEHTNFLTGATIDWRIGDKEYLMVGFAGDQKSGIMILDKSTLEYKMYELSYKVNTFFVDADNNLWLGTDGGVLIASHLLGAINSIPITSTKTNQTTNPGNVYTIHETKNHFWLTKRYGHGIFKYDKNWTLIKEFGSYYINNIPYYPKIQDGFDFRILDNTMYVTNDLGIFLIDNTTHLRRHIFTPEHGEVKLRNIIPINDTTWFIRSYNKGIFVFNPKQKTFRKKYDLVDSTGNVPINFLFKTNQNNIIASSNYGLYFYDENLNKFTLKDHSVFNRLSIFGIAEDQNNILWVCTNKGIMSYDFQKNEILADFSQYIEMGMAYRVNVDKNNNVWFSNAKGYWSWNQKSKRMLKLNFDSGLVTEVEDSYIHIGADDRIYLGGKDIVHQLNPSYISTSYSNTRVIISYISINNEVKIPTLNNNNYQLSLPPGYANIDISFAVPDYSMEHSYDYQFKFSYSDAWTDSKDGKIFIPSLSHGQYQILMRGVSNFSGADTDIVTLDISISPYWYQTWWFRCLVGLCTVSLLYFFYKWKLAYENEKNKLKAEYEHRMIHLEMQNLRSQMNPHFIFNALNSINGFIVENKTHLASEYLTKFSKLIRMILDHSQSDMIPLAKEIEALNLYVMMEKNRFDQAFDFYISKDSHIDMDDIDIPPLILQPYIENAIWHGLMHQTKMGIIQITISQQDDRLFFTINDNGVGRKKAEELKSKKNVKTNSYGMKITQKRIKNNHMSNDVIVSDIVDESGNILGTKVIISIKII